jgi:hypothetical protein
VNEYLSATVIPYFESSQALVVTAPPNPSGAVLREFNEQHQLRFIGHRDSIRLGSVRISPFDHAGGGV